MTEFEAFYAEQASDAHARTGRRVRDMYGIFDVEPERRNGRWIYPLRGWATKTPADAAGHKGISALVHGEVLSAARCAQCGNTPADDHATLEVDHKIPHSWGGTDDIENLLPLCTHCKHDKQTFYSSMGPF